MRVFLRVVAAAAAILGHAPCCLADQCEVMQVHRNNLQYPQHLGDADSLGCFKYANISDSRPFVSNNVWTVYWEVHHTGSNELHFALSEGWVTKSTDVQGNTRGFRNALYRQTNEGIGLHTLYYGYPVREYGQRFYELLMYPSGSVRVRRVSCFPNENPNGGCQRWGGGTTGSFGQGFTYNSNNNPHKFWLQYNRGTGRYKFGSGDTLDQNVIINWVDPRPIPVNYISANVYCCNRAGCQARRDDNAGYFCFCTGPNGGWCRGSASPTTPPPSAAPSTPMPTTGAPTRLPTRSPTFTRAPSSSFPSSTPTSRPTMRPTISEPTASPTSTPSGSPSKPPTPDPTRFWEQSMPDQLTDEQQQTVDTARNMRINDLRTALRQGGVPYEATYTVSVDDLARVAVLYNVVLGPDSTRPTPAPQNGGGGGGGGGGDVSSSTGDDSSGDSTVTVVVVAAVVIVLLVAVLAVVIVKKNVAAKAQARNVGFDNPMYDTNTQADPGENNSGYMEVGASAN